MSCDSELLTFELLQWVPDKFDFDEDMESASAGPCSTENVNGLTTLVRYSYLQRPKYSIEYMYI